MCQGNVCLLIPVMCLVLILIFLTASTGLNIYFPLFSEVFYVFIVILNKVHISSLQSCIILTQFSTSFFVGHLAEEYFRLAGQSLL